MRTARTLYFAALCLHTRLVELQEGSDPSDNAFAVDPKLPWYIRLPVVTRDAWVAFADPTLRFYVLYVTFTWLGNFVSPFFFSFHLLDIINRSPTVRAVLQAVTHNGHQLVMTFVVLVSEISE